ncbi:MAG TPA: hypothetical protein VM243_02975, partial [Phycisphaerae bacterium]|nr:hypothetical protein [Phycisphaerae bacterium]
MAEDAGPTPEDAAETAPGDQPDRDDAPVAVGDSEAVSADPNPTGPAAVEPPASDGVSDGLPHGDLDGSAPTATDDEMPPDPTA